jgi:hypothetical protein
MPTTSRAFVKVSILCLVLGALLGALLLVNRWLPLDPRLATLKGSHVQLLIVGWLTQLILGVAWWLFPPLALHPRSGGTRPARRGQAQRGSEPLFWATFLCLNAGVLLRVVFEPLQAWTQVGFFGFLVGISGLFLLAAAVAFVANMWGRVRELGRRK